MEAGTLGCMNGGVNLPLTDEEVGSEIKEWQSFQKYIGYMEAVGKRHCQFERFHDPEALIEEPPFGNPYRALHKLQAAEDGSSSGGPCLSDYSGMQSSMIPLSIIPPDGSSSGGSCASDFRGMPSSWSPLSVISPDGSSSGGSLSSDYRGMQSNWSPLPLVSPGGSSSGGSCASDYRGMPSSWSPLPMISSDGSSSGGSCASDYQRNPFPVISPEFEAAEDGNSSGSCKYGPRDYWSAVSRELAQIKPRGTFPSVLPEFEPRGPLPMVLPEIEATEDCNSSVSCGSEQQPWSASGELASLDSIVLEDIPVLAEETGCLMQEEAVGLGDQISDSSLLGEAVERMFPSGELVEDKEERGMELVQQLLGCAQAISKGDVAAAQQHVRRLGNLISPEGNSMERVATYFTKALAARLGYHQSDRSCGGDVELSPVEQKLRAVQTFYTYCPYQILTHFTANQAILEAFDGEEMVHVVDLDIKQGLQWPSLIQALSERPMGPPKLRITFLVGDTLDTNSVEATRQRLLEFADTFRVPLKITILSLTLEILRPCYLGIIPDEALAVNCVGSLHMLGANPRVSIDSFLEAVRSLNPSVVTIVEEDADHEQDFLPRFMNALHYYSSMFDSLAATCTSTSQAKREAMERLLMGSDIMDIVGREGLERCLRHRTANSWISRMEQSGFRLRPLSDWAVFQAKCLLQMWWEPKFCIKEEDCYLSVCWQDQPLYCVSSWY